MIKVSMERGGRATEQLFCAVLENPAPWCARPVRALTTQPILQLLKKRSVHFSVLRNSVPDKKKFQYCMTSSLTGHV